MISTEVFTFAVSKYFKRLNLPMSHLSTSLIVSKFWNRERFQGIEWEKSILCRHTARVWIEWNPLRLTKDCGWEDGALILICVPSIAPTMPGNPFLCWKALTSSWISCWVGQEIFCFFQIVQYCSSYSLLAHYNCWFWNAKSICNLSNSI
jgi:hypothetical protein